MASPSVTIGAPGRFLGDLESADRAGPAGEGREEGLVHFALARRAGLGRVRRDRDVAVDLVAADLGFLRGLRRRLVPAPRNRRRGRRFRWRCGIPPSGACSSASSSSGSSYSNNDVNLLARLIYGEARGESYVGQVAVGAVVLNRVKSASFPNTISGVIYQSNAFTAVLDGQINLAPDSTSIRAAKDAMNGWDPSYGSLYYYNPVKTTSKWILSRRTVITIGNHVFAV